jgi:hydrogenase maturation protein HypF
LAEEKSESEERRDGGMIATYHIHINGIVQGVGFRPMVYQLAREMQLKGQVKNGSDGVHIFFNADEGEADLFFGRVLRSAPVHAKIISHTLKKVDDRVFTDFSIVVDNEPGCGKQVLLSPDRAICDECRRELHDKDSRRYRYPFITCTHCGPRYSILQDLPYERHFTSMQKFSQCKSCDEEYHDVADRRFFSQTNSCGECGVELCIRENALSVLSNEYAEVLLRINDSLRQGKIIAVKGVGGYLLLCDAGNPDCIQLLRSRKRRPNKPFAVLYPDSERVRKDFAVNAQEEGLLESEAAPIVLLYPKQGAFENLAVKDIAPGLKRVGVMLPGSPLLDLIARDYGGPLVATSANISGSPIIYRDADALAWLFGIANLIVSDNREIVIPQDDSVVLVTQYGHRQIILRRSRGYAPSFPAYAAKQAVCSLSMGAFLKSSFTLSVNGNVFVSQFLGSGERYESQQMYKDTLTHWMGLYGVRPGIVLADMHGGYFSQRYGTEVAESYGIAVKYIQHHEAHFAAVLAENNLLCCGEGRLDSGEGMLDSREAGPDSDERGLDPAEPVLGVIWDGTGLGTDGHIWGGEFFKYEHNELLRCYHFDYFPVIAGDKMAMEPRIAALCACHDAWPPRDELKRKFTETEWGNYQSLASAATVFTSSVGRLFDAVASMLDICDRQTYEGEAAMYLQALAEEYVSEYGFDMDDAYFKEGSHYYRIPTSSLVQGVSMDIKKGKVREYIAAKFHYSLVRLIGIVAQNIQVRKICFSGGVFQNALLTDWIQHEYKEKYQLYFHQNLSPNDENISFGQMVYYENKMSTRAAAGPERETIEENESIKNSFQPAGPGGKTVQSCV